MRLVLLTLLLAASASAQSLPDSTEVGRIVGVVTEAGTGEPLIGTNVWLVETPRGAVTNLDGRFAIEGVPVGAQAVRVSYVGFRSFEAEVTVRAGGTTPLRVALEPDVLCEVFVLHAPEIVSRGVYASRVASYHVRKGPDDPWGPAACQEWLEPDPSPMMHPRTR